MATFQSKTRRSLSPAADATPSGPAAPEVVKNQWGMQTVHTKTIDGFCYTTYLYGAEQGFDYLPLFVSLASGPVGVALETVGRVIDAGGALGEARVNGAGIAEALHNAAATIVEMGGASKLREMLASTTVKNVKGAGDSKVDEVFDELFAGRYTHLIKVLAWVVEVNYAPFGGGVRSAILSRWTEISEKLQAASKTPQQG